MSNCKIDEDEKILESTIQKKLETELGYGHAKCVAGIVDILTPTTIIEIKNWNCWKHALGQLLAYYVHFPDKTMRAHFFRRNS